MTVPAWEETGPEAAATLGRLTDPRRVLTGEGGTVTAGSDRDTSCLLIESGTALDLIGDEDLDERERRSALRLLRFASDEARAAYVADRWRVLDTAASEPPSPAPRQATIVELGLYAGLSNTRVELSLGGDRGGWSVGLRTESEELPQIEIVDRAGDDEVERFLEELRVLEAPSWQQYRAQAMDGLLWHLTARGGITIDAGGANAFPPRGEGPRATPTFERLLLAAERMLGRHLWIPRGERARLEAVPDRRDRVEQLILSACRSWVEELRQGGGDPGKLQERHFHRGLVPHLRELADCATEGRPMLADWDPGAVDLVLEPEGRPTWVELKWCRHRETFGNCLWDTAKLAAGVREGRAQHGYLLVGAPVALWEQPGPHSSVIGVSCHPGASLVEDHSSWWRFWCRENRRTYPRRLPAPVMTAPVGRARHFGRPRSPWEIRLIRAEAPGADTYVAPCP